MKRLLVIQHIEREGPGLFEEIANELGIEMLVTRPDLGDSLPKPSKQDVLLILGGPMGVRDISNPIYPWLCEEINLVRYCISKEIGFIGVCLGAQLLAYAAGGKIQDLKDGYPCKPSPEIGWAPIFAANGTNKLPLMSYFNSPLDALHWHGDRILLPQDSRLLAFSQKCREQFFQVGPLAYGLQCHIEINEPMINKWISEDKEFILKGLGKSGAETLYFQQQLFCNRSKFSRMSLIYGLMKSF